VYLVLDLNSAEEDALPDLPPFKKAAPLDIFPVDTNLLTLLETVSGTLDIVPAVDFTALTICL
jgi:hypothetical protein